MQDYIDPSGLSNKKPDDDPRWTSLYHEVEPTVNRIARSYTYGRSDLYGELCNEAWVAVVIVVSAFSLAFCWSGGQFEKDITQTVNRARQHEITERDRARRAVSIVRRFGDDFQGLPAKAKEKPRPK